MSKQSIAMFQISQARLQSQGAPRLRALEKAKMKAFMADQSWAWRGKGTTSVQRLKAIEEARGINIQQVYSEWLQNNAYLEEIEQALIDNDFEQLFDKGYTYEEVMEIFNNDTNPEIIYKYLKNVA